MEGGAGDDDADETARLGWTTLMTARLMTAWSMTARLTTTWMARTTLKTARLMTARPVVGGRWRRDR